MDVHPDKKVMICKLGRQKKWETVGGQSIRIGDLDLEVVGAFTLKKAQSDDNASSQRRVGIVLLIRNTSSGGFIEVDPILTMFRDVHNNQASGEEHFYAEKGSNYWLPVDLGELKPSEEVFCALVQMDRDDLNDASQRFAVSFKLHTKPSGYWKDLLIRVSRDQIVELETGELPKPEELLSMLRDR